MEFAETFNNCLVTCNKQTIVCQNIKTGYTKTLYGHIEPFDSFENSDELVHLGLIEMEDAYDSWTNYYNPFLDFLDNTINKLHSDMYENSIFSKYKIKTYRNKSHLINSIYIVEKEVLQCEQDGTQNIVPFILMFRKTTKELKHFLTPKLWKLLCSKTLSFNILISKSLSYGFGYREDDTQEDIINILQSLAIKKRKHIAHRKYTKGYPLVYLSNINEERDAFVTSIEAHDIINLVQDTVSMKKSLGKTFSINWSLRRMKEEHDISAIELIEIKNRQYDQDFKLIDDDMSFLPDNVKPLVTVRDVLYEAHNMVHCGADYLDDCIDGKYMFFHISEDGDSTLGVSTNMLDHITTTFIYDQHYAIGNTRPSEENETIARKIITLLQNRPTTS